MSKSESFDALKAQLVRKEKLYKGKISEESEALEAHSKKLLKSSAIVGLSLVLGFGLYKLLAGKEIVPEQSKKKKVKTDEPTKNKQGVFKVAIVDKIVAFAIQTGLRYISKKIRSNDEGDSQSAAA